jgi:hypothetical protein
MRTNLIQRQREGKSGRGWCTPLPWVIPRVYVSEDTTRTVPMTTQLNQYLSKLQCSAGSVIHGKHAQGYHSHRMRAPAQHDIVCVSRCQVCVASVCMHACMRVRACVCLRARLFVCMFGTRSRRRTAASNAGYR